MNSLSSLGTMNSLSSLGTMDSLSSLGAIGLGTKDIPNDEVVWDILGS